MKKCIIYVFSGTGNSKLVAELYKEKLTDYETQIFNITMPEGKLPDNVPSPADFDLVGIGHPVHGFNAPKIMWDFCKQLPKVENKSVFIFTTSGEGLWVNDYASQKIVRRMKHNGYKFIQQRRYVMPYNMIFRHSPEMVKSEWLYAQRLADYSCKKIMEGEVEKVHSCNAAAFFVPIVRILWIYARVQSPFMKVDSKKCINCQKCVKVCPYGNISYDAEKNKFKFGNNCVLCVACSFGCPTCAISIGLLNGWRINGDYRIKKTAQDESIQFPYFTKEKLKGLKRIAYLNYYKKLDKLLNQEK